MTPEEQRFAYAVSAEMEATRRSMGLRVSPCGMRCNPEGRCGVPECAHCYPETGTTTDPAVLTKLHNAKCNAEYDAYHRNRKP